MAKVARQLPAGYRGLVAEVQIVTPRGVALRGTFENPGGSSNRAVLFSHPLLCDRFSSPHFPTLSKVYQDAGYATLIFDYSGHGLSDDDNVVMNSRVEDLRAASGWLADQGFDQQLLHAHSSGALSGFRAKPPAVRSMFVTSGVLGPMTYDWDLIFGSSQLEQLDRTGIMEIMDDTPGPRKLFTLTSQTLVDLSLNKAQDLLKDLDVPVMLVYDQADEEAGLIDLAAEAFQLLPDGSRLEVVRSTAFSDEANLGLLSRIARDWSGHTLPPRGSSG